jgi:hypothetical protein
MRCPYCGGINSDRTSYCTYCGRDLKSPPRPVSGQQPPYQPSRPGAGQQGRPSSMPQAPQPARPVSAPPSRTGTPVPPQTAQRARHIVEPPVPVTPPPPPEPPAPFPPNTVTELQALEQGALAYSVVESGIGDGRKKIVRIVYPKGVAWQQVATLLKAFHEQQEKDFDTILIQGVLEQDTSVYAFTNGQLRFDRNVRLGGMTTDRYQIETGNGFESDSVRIVLSTTLPTA